jgi:hypothetical protein
MSYHIYSKVYANFYNKQIHTVLVAAQIKKKIVLEKFVKTTFQEMLIMSVTKVII